MPAASADRAGSSTTATIASIVSRAPSATDSPRPPSSRGRSAWRGLILTIFAAGSRRAMRGATRAPRAALLPAGPRLARGRRERHVQVDRIGVGGRSDHDCEPDSRERSKASIRRWAKSTEEARGWLVRCTSEAHRASSTWRTSARASWKDVARQANCKGGEASGWPARPWPRAGCSGTARCRRRARSGSA